MKLLQNSKFTGPALILLLVLNTSLLVLLLIRHQPPPPPPFQNPIGMHPGPREFLVHELKMDERQQKSFDELIKIHRDSMEKIQHDIHLHRDSLVAQLGKAFVDSSRINSIADKIGNDQAQIEKVTFQHFRQVRGICTPAQQPKFDTIIREALRFMGPPDGPPPPRGHHGPPPPPGNGPPPNGPPPPGNGPPPNGPPPPGNGPPPQESY